MHQNMNQFHINANKHYSNLEIKNYLNKLDQIYFEYKLKEILQFELPKHSNSEIYEWALFPFGKLFRPFIFKQWLIDLFSQSKRDMKGDELIAYIKNITQFAIGLEIHHAYSLAHDDLPCMDNDDFRRGKYSLHKKYGEWQALLIGDGLIILSFKLMQIALSSAFINNSHIEAFSRNYPWMNQAIYKLTGPKGLIQGQYLDLSLEMRQNFSTLIRTHQLKTGRLIQLSLLAAVYFSGNGQFQQFKEAIRLGDKIGILFQLLDDLSELEDANLSKHENEVNPWPKDYSSCLNYTSQLLNDLLSIKDRYPCLFTYLAHYFHQMSLKIKKQKVFLETIKINSTPVTNLLDLF